MRVGDQVRVQSSQLTLESEDRTINDRSGQGLYPRASTEHWGDSAQKKSGSLNESDS